MTVGKNTFSVTPYGSDVEYLFSTTERYFLLCFAAMYFPFSQITAGAEAEVRFHVFWGFQKHNLNTGTWARKLDFIKTKGTTERHFKMKPGWRWTDAQIRHDGP